MSKVKQYECSPKLLSFPFLLRVGKDNQCLNIAEGGVRRRFIKQAKYFSCFLTVQVFFPLIPKFYLSILIPDKKKKQYSDSPFSLCSKNWVCRFLHKGKTPGQAKVNLTLLTSDSAKTDFTKSIAEAFYFPNFIANKS